MNDNSRPFIYLYLYFTNRILGFSCCLRQRKDGPDHRTHNFLHQAKNNKKTHRNIRCTFATATKKILILNIVDCNRVTAVLLIQTYCRSLKCCSHDIEMKSKINGESSDCHLIYTGKRRRRPSPPIRNRWMIRL